MLSNSSIKQNRKSIWLSGAAMLAAFAAAPAWAQTDDSQIEETENQSEESPAVEAAENDVVVVTGSRIRRAGFDTLQAATVTSDEDIEVRGYTNIADALEDTPGFGVSDSSPVGTSQSTLGVAQTFVDFFGLGSQRTLTLVNGRRFVSSNSISGSGAGAAPGSQVDLNVIPASLVERVETVSIGGAPVYGADAIAGTVNIILKDDFEGVEASAQYGLTDENDAESKSIRALLGGNFGNGRGNAVISAEYNEQEGLILSDRLSFYNLVPNPMDGGESDGIPAQMVVEDTRFAVLTEGGLPYDNQLFAVAGLDLPGIVFPPIYENPNYIYDANGTPLQFGPDGNLVPYVTGEVVQAALGAPVLTDGGDGVNPADHFGLLSPTERTLINGIAHYDITPWARAFVENSYAHTEGVEQSELYQFAAPAALGGPAITLSVDNAFLSEQARRTILANGLTEFNINRNFNDITERDPGKTSVDVYRFVGGFEGDFNALDRTWSWDMSYTYGRSESVSGLTYINPDRLFLAADAVRNSQGEVVCASGGDCVPINLFGVNNFSNEAADYVTDRGRATSLNTQQVLTANLTGDFQIGLPEPIGFNIGAEHREEEGLFDPDATLEAGILLLGPGTNGFAGVEGGYETDEVYGEVYVPLVTEDQNLGFIRALSTEGAIRYVDNSLTGSDTTWSAGARFAPRAGRWSDGLVFRGVYTHAIRSPAITELFLGSAPLATGVTDPCNAQNYNQGPSPSVREANCRSALNAVGAPAPESFENTTGTVSAFGSVSGNPNLRNETADSWSVGFVYQPAALPGFRMSLDYSNISLEDGIQTLGLNALLATCYDSQDFPSEDACGTFNRLTAAEAAAQPGATRVAGDIANGYTTGYFNTSTLDFAGVIANLEYEFEIEDLFADMGDAGSVALGAKLFYTDEYKSVLQPGAPETDAAGEIGTPEFRGAFTAAYARDVFGRALDLNLQALWTDSVVRDNLATTENLPAEALYIDDYWRFNATVGYALTDQVRAQLAVNNLFDADVPYGAKVSRSLGSYDPIGRTFLLRLTATLQ